MSESIREFDGLKLDFCLADAAGRLKVRVERLTFELWYQPWPDAACGFPAPGEPLRRQPPVMAACLVAIGPALGEGVAPAVVYHDGRHVRTLAAAGPLFWQATELRELPGAADDDAWDFLGVEGAEHRDAVAARDAAASAAEGGGGPC